MPIYWAFLTYMLLKSGQDLPQISFLEMLNFAEVDKVIHVGIFVMLAFLLKLNFPRMSFLLFIIITFLYSVLTEVLQEYMALGRSMELYDLFADIFGLLIGYFSAQFLLKYLLKKQK